MILLKTLNVKVTAKKDGAVRYVFAPPNISLPKMEQNLLQKESIQKKRYKEWEINMEITVGSLLGIIKDRIMHKQVIPPDDMTVDELKSWLIGYSDCLEDIQEIFDSLIIGEVDVGNEGDEDDDPA